MKIFKSFIMMFVSLFLILSVGNASASDDFPYRKDFPDVQYIETEDLNSQYDDVIIIDVRSKFEFDVVHVSKAKNVPIAKASFAKDIGAIRGKKDSKKLVFYCNGHTCKKSYKATMKAKESGFENVFAYDSGIFDWITAHPDKGVLMGDSPVPTDKIIPKNNLNAKMLAFDDFKSKAEGDNTVVIDIREPFQRKVIPEVKKIKNIPLDRLTKLLEKGEFKDKNLYIFDAVGKQVRWLQYHLEKRGYENYNFLKKGVGGIGK